MTRLTGVEENMENLTETEMSQEQRAMSQKQHEMSLEQREITENVTKLLTKVEEMNDNFTTLLTIQNQNTNDTKRLKEEVRKLQMAIKRKSLGLV